jgi:hypothetical protein
VRTANAAAPAPARPKAPAQPIAAAPKAIAPAVQPAPKQETAAAEPQTRTAAAQAPGPSASLMSGAQPIVPTNSFESRFGGFR